MSYIFGYGHLVVSCLHRFWFCPTLSQEQFWIFLWFVLITLKLLLSCLKQWAWLCMKIVWGKGKKVCPSKKASWLPFWRWCDAAEFWWRFRLEFCCVFSWLAESWGRLGATVATSFCKNVHNRQKLKQFHGTLMSRDSRLDSGQVKNLKAVPCQWRDFWDSEACICLSVEPNVISGQLSPKRSNKSFPKMWGFITFPFFFYLFTYFKKNLSIFKMLVQIFFHPNPISIPIWVRHNDSFSVQFSNTGTLTITTKGKR